MQRSTILSAFNCSRTERPGWCIGSFANDDAQGGVRHPSPGGHGVKPDQRQVEVHVDHQGRGVRLAALHVLNPTLGGRSLTDPEVSDDAMARAFNMLSAFSSLGSLATIILATIFIIEIDLCCDADDIVEFVQRHQHMFELLL
ncbi:hypothetical protein HaLaN_20228, partial [Haematococcus lacustris]